MRARVTANVSQKFREALVRPRKESRAVMNSVDDVAVLLQRSAAHRIRELQLLLRLGAAQNEVAGVHDELARARQTEADDRASPEFAMPSRPIEDGGAA